MKFVFLFKLSTVHINNIDSVQFAILKFFRLSHAEL